VQADISSLYITALKKRIFFRACGSEPAAVATSCRERNTPQRTDMIHFFVVFAKKFSKIDNKIQNGFVSRLFYHFFGRFSAV
jgi:hypothetical protein